MIHARLQRPPHFPRLDVHKEINDSAEAVKKNIIKDYNEERKLDGSSQKKLSPVTIDRKGSVQAGQTYSGKKLTSGEAAKVRKNKNKSLVATENLMFNVLIDKATSARQRAIMTIGKTRANIAKHLEEKGFGIPFGVSKQSEKDIDTILDAKIKRYARGIR